MLKPLKEKHKPCPKCNSKKIYYEYFATTGKNYITLGNVIVVLQCQNCKYEFYKKYKFSELVIDTLKDWNKLQRNKNEFKQSK
jgi:predicted nucleic-acid-binding Zn-ribbon protein